MTPKRFVIPNPSAKTLRAGAVRALGKLIGYHYAGSLDKQSKKE